MMMMMMMTTTRTTTTTTTDTSLNMCLLPVVYGEWSSSPEGAATSIPLLYFCETKLTVWSNVADRAAEACRTTHTAVSRYFDTHRRDIVSQLVGMISNQSCLLYCVIISSIYTHFIF